MTIERNGEVVAENVTLADSSEYRRIETEYRRIESSASFWIGASGGFHWPMTPSESAALMDAINPFSKRRNA